MSILAELKTRFAAALESITDSPADYLDMIRAAQNPQFGDYQANFAMSLGKRIGRPPRDVAADIVAKLDVADLCHEPEVAGPGFINLRLKDDVLSARLQAAVTDERLGIEPTDKPRTYVVDYSAPNVAKPMHVGHIRSTAIGDAICRTLRFLGHRVISDNHLGDWGTQFGMIIYGYKNFRDQAAYDANPVQELAHQYRLVNQLVDYFGCKKALPNLEQAVEQTQSELADFESAEAPADKSAKKQAKKRRKKLQDNLNEAAEKTEAARAKIAAVDSSPELSAMASAHPQIATSVLEETAKLHAGDEENLRLWNEFLPLCREVLHQLYDRLSVTFDYEYGESYYHEMLGDVVADMKQRGMAVDSEGAVCVFIDGFDAPMIIQKQDGAFLYATTDLATIRFRMETWKPDAILYVVDHRQSEHFDKLFAAARMWGYDDVELVHVSFGTVLGTDGKPFKTRSGDTVGLESLLDEAVSRAMAVVSKNDDAKPKGAELSQEARARIADAVGHAAIKYADLSQNRTSDYVFSFDKMVALEGNTATYMQYSYARTQSIFERGGVDVEQLRSASTSITLEHPMERAMALELLRFGQALEESTVDFRPNQLTNYLFDLAKRFSEFYQQCHVLKAEDESLRNSRLLLCDLTGRTIRQGLDLLGIRTVDRM